MTETQKDLVPVLDLGAFLAHEPGALAATASQLRDALERIGFFFVINHGVPWSLVEDTFAAAARFHALDDEVKATIPFGGDRGGYLTLGGGTSYASRIAGDVRKPNLNAAFFVHGSSNEERNQWPPEAACPGFRRQVDAYFAATQALGTAMLPLYALALGLPAGYFEGSFDRPSCSLRMSHYPVVEHEDQQWGLAPHTDSSFMTLLPDNAVAGLEIKPEGYDWIRPPALAESYLVNAGDILRRWTNDRFLSTGHRVFNASGQDRYAIPFFYAPRTNAPIACLPSCTGAGNPPRYEPTTYGDYLRWFMNRNYAGVTGQSVTDDDMP